MLNNKNSQITSTAFTALSCISSELIMEFNSDNAVKASLHTQDVMEVAASLPSHPTLHAHSQGHANFPPFYFTDLDQVVHI
jgi:hypothetical protein